MRAFKIILRILFVLAMVLITGDWLLQRFWYRRVPEVVVSSVSPDGKWICELVELNPHPHNHSVMIRARENRGDMKRNVYYGYGEVYLEGWDSIPPSDEAAEFIWKGNEVTVRELFIPRFVKIKVGDLGSEIVDSSKRQERAKKEK